MKRLFWQMLGVTFLILGILFSLLPIPFGLLFLMLALIILVPTSPWFVKTMRRVRARSRMVDSLFAGVTRRVPVPYKRVLRATEPFGLSTDRW